MAAQRGARRVLLRSDQERSVTRRAMRRIVLLIGIVAALAWLAAPAAHADEIELRAASLHAVEDGLVLDADFAFELTPRLAEVLVNGVPLYFRVDFELKRPRWYWVDEKAASKRLQLRLSYHALSRQYRLSTGLLQQNFATLDEALNVLKRLRNWLVVDRTVGFSDADYEAALRMRLDTTLLPKPFQLLALARRYRARVFGARLTLRLLMRFALLAVVPGLIVYAVSVQFITRSIESWFDVKVDAALEGGITLGQQAIDQTVLDMQAKARAMALELAGRSGPQIVSQLERLREQAGVQEAAVLTASGRLIASASEDVTKLLPDLPAAQLLRQARASRGYTAVDSAAGRPLSLRVVVPMSPMALSDEASFLQLRQSVAPAFSRSLEAVEAAHRDYRELAISRDGLKRIYVVTLSFEIGRASCRERV